MPPSRKVKGKKLNFHNKLYVNLLLSILRNQRALGGTIEASWRSYA